MQQLFFQAEGSGYTTFTDSGDWNRLKAGTSYHIPLRMCLEGSHANLAALGGTIVGR